MKAAALAAGALLVFASAPAADPLAGAVVCLDPGHPSETSAGTTGPHGVTESHLNWVLARRLEIALRRRGVEVVMTKSREDEHVTNRRRAEIANEAGAMVMLRLHCDAGPASGFEIFHPDRPGTRDGFTGPTPEVIAASRALAAPLYRGMAEVLEPDHPGRGIAGDSKTFVGSKQGALTGSIFARVPTLLVEMGVLTNPRDERFLVSPAGQRRLVEAMVRGLERVAAVAGRPGASR